VVTITNTPVLTSLDAKLKCRWS